MKLNLPYVPNAVTAAVAATTNGFDAHVIGCTPGDFLVPGLFIAPSIA
jgi:hypothetical protein